ncbi:hypothetical protein K466DRAFT_209509 [Polyporus arcularius HHB13444]|uniref:Uncharacterized protein n=1 Tax=Polyporus arcularius HHB13444 TaxID=1314778 RepID=A0A5C3P7H9_9APHY|nr:hypothetical protein K466DRAFT_209509 [Polyporus arcularius HHB13444]
MPFLSVLRPSGRLEVARLRTRSAPVWLWQRHLTSASLSAHGASTGAPSRDGSSDAGRACCHDASHACVSPFRDPLLAVYCSPHVCIGIERRPALSATLFMARCECFPLSARLPQSGEAEQGSPNTPSLRSC